MKVAPRGSGAPCDGAEPSHHRVLTLKLPRRQEEADAGWVVTTGDNAASNLHSDLFNTNSRPASGRGGVVTRQQGRVTVHCDIPVVRWSTRSGEEHRPRVFSQKETDVREDDSVDPESHR